jgi:hypothetical protein
MGGSPPRLFAASFRLPEKYLRRTSIPIFFSAVLRFFSSSLVELDCTCNAEEASPSKGY